MPRTPNDDGQDVGRLLLLVGLMLVLLGVVLGGYLVFTGGFDAEDRLGGGDSDFPLVALTFAALIAGALLAAAGAVARSVRRPGGHHAYLNLDDDDWC